MTILRLANLSKQVKYEMKPSYKKVTELDGGGNMVVNSHKVKMLNLIKKGFNETIR